MKKITREKHGHFIGRSGIVKTETKDITDNMRLMRVTLLKKPERKQPREIRANKRKKAMLQ